VSESANEASASAAESELRRNSGRHLTTVRGSK
jgi:hypothetical protein